MNTLTIRKLGSIETFLSQNFQLTFSFKISSQIDIYNEKLLVYDSLKEWKHLNPLLKCRIVKNNLSEFMFEWISNEHNDNTEFNKVQINEWNLMVDNEINKQIDIFDSYLWCLKFIKLENLNEKYLILFTVNHSILDGRSGYTILLELLQIIQDKFENKFKRSQSKQVFESVEDLILKKHKNDDLVYFQPFAHKAPHFLNSYECLNKSSFLRFKIESEKLNQLVLKCKSNDVKMTSCLNLLWVFAFKMLYSNHGIRNEQITFTNSISLRQFNEFPFKNESQNHLMGYYINNLNESFRDEINFENEKEWIHQFWRLSSEYSCRLHERLNRGEQFKSSSFVGKLEEDEFYLHFGLSNMGCVTDSLNKNSSISVDECYVHLRIDASFRGRWLMTHYFTINNTLFGSLTYNPHMMPQSIIDQIYENFKFIINKIV